MVSAPPVFVQPGGPSGTRLCSRPVCAEPAIATLSFQYNRGSVWVDVLWAERDPHTYDLCDGHADRVSVPRGWRLDDRRELVERVARVALPAGPPASPAAGPAVESLPAPLPTSSPERLAG